MTTICTRCHRPLKRDPVWIAGHAYGPKCGDLVLGSMFRPAAPAAHSTDERQPDLFDNSLRARAARFFAAWWDSLFEFEVHL
jgi:hypothetical protein